MAENEQRNHRPWWSLPAPPWWLFVLFALADAGTGVWRVITVGNGAGGFVSGLLWPGLVVGCIVFVVAYLGWNLELE